MSTVLTNKFRLHNAESFKEGFSESEKTNIYMSIGKVTEWSPSSPDNLNDDRYSGSSSVSGDLNVPNPPNSIQSEFQLWRNMISCKMVQPSDVSYVVPRVDWVQNQKIYKQYSDLSTDLYIDTQNPFYVLTDEFNVYKCISNNGNSISKKKPTGTKTEGYIEHTDEEDGYVWKYMYTISSTDAYKFVTPNFIPVKTIETEITTTGSGFSSESIQWEVRNNSIDGELATISRDVTYDSPDEQSSKGSGYEFKTGVQMNTSSIQLTDNDTRTSFQLSDSSLEDVDNYYNGCTLYFSNPGEGKSEVVLIIDEYKSESSTNKTIYVEGDVTSRFSADTNTTFDILPTVKVEGDGVGFEGIPVKDEGTGISKIKIINGGSGYTKALVSFVNPGNLIPDNPTNFPTLNAKFFPVISPKGGHGFDPVKELGGFFVMLNVKFNFDEYQITTDNDFRQVGLIRDPLQYSLDVNGDIIPLIGGGYESQLALDNAYLQTQIISLTNEDTINNFTNTKNIDQILRVSGDIKNNAVIVDVIEEVENGLTVKKLRVSNFNGSFNVDDEIEVVDSEGSPISKASVLSIKHQSLVPYSGEVLFVEQRSPVTRNKNQIEDIKIILEF